MIAADIARVRHAFCEDDEQQTLEAIARAWLRNPGLTRFFEVRPRRPAASQLRVWLRQKPDDQAVSSLQFVIIEA